MLVALVMAGGSGTRFWPLSRGNCPKQYLKIISDKTMIRMTVDRLLPKIPIQNIYVVTAKSQVDLVRRELPDLLESNLIIEPFGMNTAPAIAISAAWISRTHAADDVMCVLPADHVIQDTDAFLASLGQAASHAMGDALVTFGVKPAYPATSYGYIEGGACVGDDGALAVKSFKEKPDIASAVRFCEAENFFWNSGMFVWKIGTIRDAYERFLPAVAALADAIRTKWETHGGGVGFDDEYRQMPRVPVDVGIMEKAERRVVIPVDYGWNDVGGWRALFEIAERDQNNNVVLGACEALDSNSNYVRSNKLVALIGVNNLVIVDTPDALLIAEKNNSERVKDIVAALAKKSLREYL